MPHFHQKSYTSPDITCRSSVETTYYKAKFNPKPVCLHCGAEDVDVASQKEMLTKYKIVFPVCFACCHSGKKEVVVEKSKRTGVVNKSSSLISCAAPSQSSRGDHRENVDMVIENVQRKRKQSTLLPTFSVVEKKKVFTWKFQMKSQIMKTQNFRVQYVMM